MVTFLKIAMMLMMMVGDDIYPDELEYDDDDDELEYDDDDMMMMSYDDELSDHFVDRLLAYKQIKT